MPIILCRENKIKHRNINKTVIPIYKKYFTEFSNVKHSYRDCVKNVLQ